MKKARVIQWATGKVGKMALQAILDDPRLELVGVYAWSPEKVGMDAGTLCGRPPCGILATADIDALISLNADSVIYTPFMADLDHVIRLLESGADVISTNLFLNVGGVRGEVLEKLSDACRRGDSSLHVTGINPGWVDAVATALTGVCRRVDSITIAEAADCSIYESSETWLALGMSLPSITPEIEASARQWLVPFLDAVERVAEALHFDLESTEFFLEFATAARKVDLGWFCMEKDTFAALRAGWKGFVGGKPVVQAHILWYLTTDLNEGWEIDENLYNIWIEGEPDLHTRIRFTSPDHWGNLERNSTTSLPAVSSIFDVMAAPAGVLTLKQVGLPSAPAGLWMKKERAD